MTTGVPLSYSLRGGSPFKGLPGLDWRIYGEKGEIRISAGGPFLQISYPDVKIEVHEFAANTVEEIEVEEEFAEFGLPARNVARVYRELTKGNNNCTFEDAVERHRLINVMYAENGIKED